MKLDLSKCSMSTSHEDILARLNKPAYSTQDWQEHFKKVRATRAVRVVIRNVETGECRTYQDRYFSLFSWQEGNDSCDCNRELNWRRAGGEVLRFDETTCSEGRFEVVSVDGMPWDMIK